MFRNLYLNFSRQFGGFIAIVLSVFYSSQISHSQCVPDCSGDPWGPPETRILPLDPCPYTGCIVEVTYVKRIACGIFKDLQITEIEVLQECSCSNQDLYEATLEALILDSPPVYQLPPPGTCDDVWRISSSNCFSQFDVGGPEGKSYRFLIPCLGEACCYTGLTICVSTSGNNVEIYTGASHAEVDCAYAIPAQGLSACFTTCEFYQLGKRPRLPRNNTTASSIDKVNHSLVLPNPVSGSTVEFELTTGNTGHASLVIYDLQGRRVAEKDVELNGETTRVALNVSHLLPGTYLYELSAAGKQLIYDKLIINKK